MCSRRAASLMVRCGFCRVSSPRNRQSTQLLKLRRIISKYELMKSQYFRHTILSTTPV